MEKLSPILGKILDKSTTIAVLLLLSWMLWQKAEKVETQMYQYTSKDRQDMIQALNESTRAMRDCTRAIDRNSLIVDQFNDRR